MKTRLISILTVLALTLALALALPASAGTIVIPAGFATVEGNLQIQTPLASSARTIQVAYAPAALTGLNVGDQITGLAFRLGGGYASWPTSDATFATYYIKLSQSLNAPNVLSTTVAANIGPDVVTVYSGTLTFAANSFPSGATPNAFGPVINFTTPYTYSGGTLLVTISHTGGGVVNGYVDADNSAPALANARYATSYDAATVPSSIDPPIIQLTTGSSGSMTLIKTASPSSAKPGDPITYTIAFGNSGAITATNVLITDTLSPNITSPNWYSSGVTLTPIEGQTYAWSAPQLAPGEGGIITITGMLTKPLAAGVFTNTVTLEVSGTVKTAEAPLTVLNVAPKANAGVDQTVGLSETVTLHGGGTDDNGDTLTYGWVQTGGPAVTLSDPAAQQPTFTAPSTAAVLTFTLTVTDTGGLSDADEVVVTVMEGVVLALTKTASPSSARPGEAITYTITFGNSGAITATNVIISDTLSPNITNPHYTSTVNLDPLVGGTIYAWSAPDLGPGEGGIITITGVLSKPLAAGVFTNTVTLAVSGTVKTANAPLTVTNVAPVANAGVDQMVGVGRQATLHGSGTDDNGDTLAYGWKQTGGLTVTLSSPTAQSPTFTAPSTAAVLTFTLTVTDTGGLKDTDEVVVKIRYIYYWPIMFRNATYP